MYLLLNKLWNRMIRYFLAGLFAILPLVITIAIVAWVADFVQRFVGPGTVVGRLLSSLGLQFLNDAPTAVSYTIGWIVVLVTVLAVGVVLESGAKRLVQRIIEVAVKRLPIIGSIYSTSKQVVDMLDKKDEADLATMTAVFCSFGKENPTLILALLVSPQRYRLQGREYQIVIVPTAPVPFGGGMFFVPADCVHPAQVPVENLMSIYVSMGVTAAELLPQDQD